MDDASESIPQAAVIALHEGRVCLVRSRSGKRWVVPKGMIDPGRTPSEMAVIEAWEEAGLSGELSTECVGEFYYEKNGLTHHARVYLLIVTRVEADWPERKFRKRVWLEPGRAAERVREPGLRQLLLELAAGVAT
ncbi:MAG: NUDIX hydrolase [Gemmataceae bacterium]|nr:NUDIX hydrolase [Gemmataceae bacterium]